jgi:transcriptional repressor NrdR
MALACRKRPVDAELEAAVDAGRTALVEPARPRSRRAVGEAVMAVLREVDEVAYVRFASVYQEFESVEQFVEAVAIRETGG